MSKRILFVDDEENILNALRRELRDWLERHHLEFEAAGSVDAALARLETASSEIMAVVSDLKMPQKKGTLLLKTVQEKWPDIATILLTGFSEIEEIKAAIQSGIISFIQKPWDPDLLKAELTRALQLTEYKKERKAHLSRMEHELTWARKIAREIMHPQPPAVAGLRLGTAYRSSSVLDCAGDFIHAQNWGQGGLLLLLGDFAVHGVEGTYFALKLREIIQAGLAKLAPGAGISAAHFLETVNNAILDTGLHLPELLMNLAVVWVDRPGLTLRFANAGAIPLFLIRNGQVDRQEQLSPGLGFRRDLMFQEHSMKLVPGDRLLVMTQGALAGRRPADLETNGELEEALRAQPAGQALAEAVLTRLAGSQTTQDDDSTVLSLEILPP